MRLASRRTTVLTLAGLCTILNGCGGGDKGPATPLVTRVSAVSLTGQQTVQEGAVIQIAATLRDAGGAVLSGRTITWTSSAPTIARVDSTGRVQGISAGSAVIQATCEGVIGTLSLVVARARVAGLNLSAEGGQTTIVAGQTLQVIATTKDQSGAVLTGRSVAWQSSNIAVASVDSTTGLVQTLSPGGVTITAASEGVSGSLIVTVVDAPPVGRLVTGGYHTCVLASIGDAYCWGWNYYGQVGDGTTQAIRASPVAVAGALRFTLLAAGSLHTCGLTQSGNAYCWGANFSGQLGDGTNTNRASPVAVKGGLTFVKLVAGGTRTCGITTAGLAYCWGAFRGSNESRVDRLQPLPVEGAMRFSALAAGANHTCGLIEGGEAYCWGDNNNAQLGGGRGEASPRPVAVTGGLHFSALVAGDDDTCGLTATGAVYCWGVFALLSSGALGPIALSGNIRFAALGSGAHCGIAANGAAYCWGDNYWGQLGDGSATGLGISPNFSAVPVAVIGGQRFAALSAQAGDGGHACGLSATGNAFCWGSYTRGQLGNGAYWGERAPAILGGVPSFYALSAGVLTSCGLTTDGSAYCWGRNDNLGDGTSVAASWSAPMPVSGNLRFATLVGSGGPGPTCGTSDGVAYCWGSKPVAVSGTLSFTSLAAAAFHTCGLTGTGAAFCWGYNQVGSVGDGTDLNTRDAPTAVSGGLSFTTLTAGGLHTCGITVAATAFCWGANGSGELGDGTTSFDRAAPVAVSGDMKFKTLVAGSAHTCGLTTDGVAYCWGNNTHGQLGDGTLFYRTAPVLVSGGQQFSALAAGGVHTCGLTAAGSAVCWGANDMGQLGDGTTGDRTAPTPVIGGLRFKTLSLSGDAALDVYGEATCGLTDAGTTYCWGTKKTSWPVSVPLQIPAFSAGLGVVLGNRHLAPHVSP